MYTNHKLKFATASIIAVAATVFGHNALAHTVIETPTITEGIRVSNNVVIGHGCGERNGIGTSVVFPDGVDSTITVPIPDKKSESEHYSQLSDSLACQKQFLGIMSILGITQFYHFKLFFNSLLASMRLSALL